MRHLGDFDAGGTLYGKFTTYTAGTGAPGTMSGGTLAVYKDDSLTESTAGVSVSVDFDSHTGLNSFTIDTGADGSFYAAGHMFDVVLTAGTVGGVSVAGAAVASFSLRRNSALKPATAGRTVVVDAAGLVDANAVKVGPSGAGTAQTARDIGASVVVGTNNDKTGYALSSAGVQAIWDALTSALTTAGSIGKWILDKLDAAMSSRLASSGYAAPLDAAGTRSAVGLASANLDTQLAGVPAAVRTNLATELGRIDVATSTRLATAGYTAPDNTGIAVAAAAAAAAATDAAAAAADTTVIRTKTDQLTFTVAGKADANVRAVNDIAIAGAGVDGTDPWRAA